MVRVLLCAAPEAQHRHEMSRWVQRVTQHRDEMSRRVQRVTQAALMDVHGLDAYCEWRTFERPALGIAASRAGQTDMQPNSQRAGSAETPRATTEHRLSPRRRRNEARGSTEKKRDRALAAAGTTLQVMMLAAALGLATMVSGQVDHCVLEPVLDLGIVLASSRSISTENYQKAVSFAFQIVSQLPVSENECR